MPSVLPVVTPVVHGPGSEVDIGATITGVDLGSLTDEQFAVIESALYKFKVVTVKDQHKLTPSEQFELVCRFDPTAKREHGHGDPKLVAAAFKGQKTLLEKGNNIPPLPIEPNVRLIGHGPQPGESQWGIPEETVLSQVSHKIWHEQPLTEEDLRAGFTRWNRWHIDSSFYERHPPRVTTLHGVKIPQGPPITVRWDDGSGTEMQIQAGTTAFLCGAAAYRRMSAQQQQTLLHSRVQYAPQPFRKHAAVRGRSNGMGQISEGREVSLEDIPAWEEEKVCTYPMLWTNPQTGEKAFQVHPIAAWKLFIKDSADGEERVIDEIAEVREWLYALQRPSLEPKFIFAPAYEQGDLTIFYNRGVFHCATEYCLDTHGPRTMHQAHVAGSSPPE